MKRLAVAGILFAMSCAAPQKSSVISVAISGIGAMDPGESEELAKTAESRLRELLGKSPRFNIRPAGGESADWLIHGVIDSWGVRTLAGGLKAEAEVRLLIVRKSDGRVLFSMAISGSASGPSGDDELLRQAAIQAVDKLFEIVARLE